MTSDFRPTRIPDDPVLAADIDGCRTALDAKR